MRFTLRCVVVFFLYYFTSLTNSVHKYIKQLTYQKTNCFVAEAPAAKTGIQVKWEFKNAPADNQVVATATDTRRSVIFTEHLKGSSGVLTINTGGDPGSYHVCMMSSVPSKEFEMKLSIYVKPGKNQKAPAVDLKKVKSYEKSEYQPTVADIKDFEDDMSDIEDLMDNVFQSAATFRNNQEKARQLSEQVDTQVWWFGIVQVILCIVLTAYQSVNIANLLLEKKLV